MRIRNKLLAYCSATTLLLSGCGSGQAAPAIVVETKDELLGLRALADIHDADKDKIGAAFGDALNLPASK